MSSKPGYYRARYHLLKAERRCVDCTAGLQEDDGVRCIECAAESRESVKAYARKPDVRRRLSKKLRTRYHADPKAAAKRMRDYRLARKLAGLCLQCTAKALDDSNFCALHREAERARCRNSYRRRNNPGAKLDPVPRLEKRARKRDWSPRDTESTERYIPIDEQLGKLRTRVLLGFRWRDPSSAGEVFEHLGLVDHRELDAAHWALLRLVRAGFIARTGKRMSYRYALTAAGIAEADRLRNVMTSSARRAA